ncbi:Acetyl-CoA acetyltransferase [Plesiocystis pacifica SIR-1]|uniref:Acetyl-CoA acetyltransferase n=1 Tax=Plesiocystis pacifica SIR-1 TaxID=391625 RepID=A6GC67_9BACT|nr:acetyl-CoA C-acetyltransferase [Plesiocystis pacifica]EDM76516.1 Acetyl-CoA acetyltransferase [Plesiocystis pacifica SIR-1]
MSEAMIFDAVRTPRGKGKASGSLYTVRPVDLLATTLRALRDRNALDTSHVDDVIAGCVTQTSEQGACIARFAALTAGYAQETSGVTLNRFCASGLEACNQAAARVAAGFEDLVIGAGVESMSRVPMGSDGGAIWDPQTQWEVGSVPQGISADLLATTRGFGREDVDAFAVDSQRKCAAAMERDAFAKSVVPVVDRNGLPVLERDEYPRPGTDMAGLAKLEPAFEMIGKQFGLDHLTKPVYPGVERIDHVHHAGNSSGIVDGAAAILFGSKAKGEALGLKARAKIRAVATIGSEPMIMLDGPIPVTRKILERAGMEIGDIDLFEVNEAFAAVPMAYMQEFDIDPAKVNVNGGAIALGHPLGATGCMLLGTLLDALEEQDKNVGLVTLCIGGGMGVATIIERV